MKFFIDELPVLFPYPKIYPEQYAYMTDLKRTLDANGHCVLEMPSGTGKTVSLLSLIVSYQKFHPAARKLIYCSRTVPEIEKALAELHALMAYRQRYNDPENAPGIGPSGTYPGRDTPLPEGQGVPEEILAAGLSSRKNLCVHPSVGRERKGKVVDARCRDMTSAWACEKGRAEPGSVELCDFHEELGKLDQAQLIPPGVWTLEAIKADAKARGVCPYFAIRRMMPYLDIVIYSFHYLLDPKVAEQVSKAMSKDAIVVFDEAHNIDNVCIESLSIDLTRPMLDSAWRSVNDLAEKVEERKKTDNSKLQEEYARLVEGLQEGASDNQEAESFMSNPVLPDDILQEAMPGNIRRAEHFVAFLKRFIEYLKTRMRVLHVVAETPPSFLQHLKDITYIEKKPLRFCAERLRVLVSTLELRRLDEYAALQKVASFATLVATYDKGFLLILEPFETEHATVPNPIFHFTCLDASLAIAPVFERFSSVIITSGTISPLDMYPKMLKFDAIVMDSYPMTLSRQCFLPLVITRGSDQVAISSRFQVRNDPAVVRNYGSILIEQAKCVPDGIVAFFPSYLYMESIVAAWHDMGILEEVWKYKLVFIETPDAPETTHALENYRRACDNGRGAILLCVARGKVSEGIDFDHNYGRAVIMFGVPYQYTESRILKARLEFLRENFRIKENDWLTFDAMRHAAQCLGRCLRGKDDYGIMVMADQRFARADKRSKLPKWIAQQVTETHSNLSTDMALVETRLFIRQMAQPYPAGKVGVSLWGVEDVERRQRKEREAYNRLLEVDGKKGLAAGAAANGTDDELDEQDYDALQLPHDDETAMDLDDEFATDLPDADEMAALDEMDV
ncbi:putative RAD3-DNA helicase/ATPase [Tilletiopsis washingtonensis]|uniref:DNA 5'-3' helicase n=1 Tax=Tilletiopsis washingtonensis TaxID=58919 RepID=A0A316ZHX0_9BASI|nr:putative RAD3-DNA helicase/ATPase [Tilletiopsis washingtonensis]PWO00867.1 putative RAD3-DNA helicase/ATPase [Tilletiopsis washingtonensis]